MSNAAQSFEQALDIVRGPHESTSLMKTRPIEPTLLAGSTDVPPGRGVHLNASGQWELGASGTQLPYFLWHGKESLDVNISGVSPITGKKHYHVHFPTGVATAFFAGGGFEFQTTEFDGDQTYAPNDPLTLDADGKVTNQNATQYTNLICGYATWHENHAWEGDDPTGPVGTNAHGMEVLTFIGDFLPAAP